MLQAIEKHRVTMTFMVPAMIHALLAEPSIHTRDLSSLRLLSYGAAPMSPARIKEAWAAFGPVLAQGYGAGETTGGVISLSIADHARAISGEKPQLLSACGRAFCESELQVLNDDGQPVLTRLHSECLTGDTLYSLKCDCGAQLEAGLKAIAEAGVVGFITVTTLPTVTAVEPFGVHVRLSSPTLKMISSMTIRSPPIMLTSPKASKWFATNHMLTVCGWVEAPGATENREATSA